MLSPKHITISNTSQEIADFCSRGASPLSSSILTRACDHSATAPVSRYPRQSHVLAWHKGTLHAVAGISRYRVVVIGQPRDHHQALADNPREAVPEADL